MKKDVSVKLFRSLGILFVVSSFVCFMSTWVFGLDLVGSFLFLSIVAMVLLCISGTAERSVEWSDIARIVLVLPFLLAAALYHDFYQYIHLPDDIRVEFLTYVSFIGGIFYVYGFLICRFCKRCNAPKDIWFGFFGMFLSCALLFGAGLMVLRIAGFVLAISASWAFFAERRFRICGIQGLMLVVIYLSICGHFFYDRHDKALFTAVIEGDITKTKKLLDSGYNVSKVSRQIGTPLRAAMFSRCIRWPYAKDAKLRNVSEKTVLQITRLLIVYGADVNW